MFFEAGTISFPGLGIDGINPPRTLPFTIFGKEIYLYGVIIALGFLLGILYLRARAKDYGTTFDLVTDAILFAVPLAIICARIYYVIFQWDYYKDNPVSVLYIWQGGIAIYGGVIGAILGLLLFAKVRKQKLLPYLDLMGLGLLIGQLVGRWGNFFNREAYGAEVFSNYFLRMGLEEAGGAVRYWHPTFLYESVWNLVGFLLLHFLSKKRKYDGQTFLQYVAWYGLGRVWIEGLRTDSLYITGTDVRVSQLLAGLSFVVAVGVMLYIRLYKEPDGSALLARQQGSGSGDQGSGIEDQGSEQSLPLEGKVAAPEALTDEVAPNEAEASDEAAPNGSAGNLSATPPDEAAPNGSAGNLPATPPDKPEPAVKPED